jgi:hypothetical protein
MAEGYVDENGRIRWAEEHDLEELALPVHVGAGDDEDEQDDDEDDEGDAFVQREG